MPDHQLFTTTMQTRTERLRELMKANGLNCRDVADILGREVNTVRVWRSKDHREIPALALRLLESELRAPLTA